NTRHFFAQQWHLHWPQRVSGRGVESEKTPLATHLTAAVVTLYHHIIRIGLAMNAGAHRRFREGNRLRCLMKVRHTRRKFIPLGIGRLAAFVTENAQPSRWLFTHNPDAVLGHEVIFAITKKRKMIVDQPTQKRPAFIKVVRLMLVA